MGRSLKRLRWIVPVFILILAGYWAAALLFMVVDPLDLFPWGATPKRAPGLLVSTHEDLIPGLVRDPTVDLLLVGGSTTGGYTSDQLRAWIGGVRNPANLSYNAPRTGDSALVLNYIERHSTARRVVIVFNYVYADQPGVTRPNFKTYLLTDNFGDGMRAVTPHVIALAVAVLRGRPIYAHSNDVIVDQKDRAQDYRSFQTRRAMDELAAALTRGEPGLADAAPQNCSAYPAVTQELAPFARTMAARGVHVDIMMPAYSTAWAGSIRASDRFERNLFERYLAAQRCVVDALDGTGGVRVVSFDEERWITDDLANYKDTGHLYSPKAAQFMFSHLDSDAYRLTRANIGGYIDDLRRRARAYQLYNSVLHYGHAS